MRWDGMVVDGRCWEEEEGVEWRRKSIDERKKDAGKKGKGCGYGYC